VLTHVGDSITELIGLPGDKETRKFMVILKNGGFKVVRTISEMKYRCLESVMAAMVKHLPWRGGLSPVHAHLCPNQPELLAQK